MIDPFSIATGLAGLVSLTIELAKTSHEYVSEVRGASSAIQNFIAELMTFKRMLSELQDAIILDANIASAFEKRCSLLMDLLDTQAASADGTVSLIDLCKSELGKMLRTLSEQSPESKVKKIGKRLKWPLEGTATEKAIASLHRYQEMFSTSIAIDNLKISASLLREIKDMRLDDTKKHSDSRMVEILNWLSPLDFAERQRDVLAKRTPGTVQWVLESSEFTAWHQAASDNVLWCPGDPGVGKTVDASVVIDFLERKRDSDQSGLAYVYCDYKNQVQQKASSLLGALSRQLLGSKESLPPAIEDVYQNSRNGKVPLDLAEQERILIQLCSLFPRVYLVIDALDEVGNVKDDGRSGLLGSLARIWTGNVLMFVTSRPHPADIRAKLSSKPQLLITAPEDDIQTFLTSEIEKDEGLPEMFEDPDFEYQIRSQISRNAHGLFLLAALHLRRLGECTCKAEIKASLQDMASTLTQTYEETLERIRRQPSSRTQLAMEVLLWTSFSRRPLKVDELQHALAITPQTQIFDKDRIRTPKVLLDVCGGLVTIEKQSSIVRLTHYTVQEFLQSRPDLLPDSNLQMARTCLDYMMLEDFTSRRSADKKSLAPGSPFRSYAVTYWGTHARGKPETVLKDQILQFLFSKHPGRLMYKVMHESMYNHLNDCGPLELVAHFGLTSLLPDILQRVTITAGAFNVAMLVADEADHLNFCRALMETFADNKDGDVTSSTILPFALIWNEAELADKLLAMESIDVNGTATHSKFTALHYAAASDESHLASLLLGKGANVDARTSQNSCPLIMASSEEMMVFLISNGADVDAHDDEGRTPLNVAAESAYFRAINLLLQHGAKTNPNKGHDNEDEYLGALLTPWHAFTRRVKAVPESKWHAFQQRRKALPVPRRAEEIVRIQSLLREETMPSDGVVVNATDVEFQDDLEPFELTDDEEEVPGYFSQAPHMSDYENQLRYFFGLHKETRDGLWEQRHQKEVS